MPESLSPQVLTLLSKVIAAKLGLNFPENRWDDLERGIRAAAPELGFERLEPCVDWLISSPLTRTQIETLASRLTVGETYFFRDRGAFRALEDEVLPRLIRLRAADRRLRIWSAGCATGEEPYSLAILLARLIPDLKAWNISIMGTDINPRAIEKAQAGVYGRWSFRDCPAELVSACFKKSPDDHFELKPEIRKMVAFSSLNLADDPYPSLLNETNALDLILCRNVLMYFAAEQTANVIAKFRQCLVEGSWLVVSATETSQTLYRQFSTVNFQGAVFYRKDQQPARPLAVATFTAAQPYPALRTNADALLPLAFPGIDEQPLELAAASTPEVGALANPPQREDPHELYQQGRYAQAMEAAESRLAANLSDVAMMVLLARILANQGRLSEALDWGNKALAREKLNPTLHYLRATILEEQGNAGEAAISLERSLYLEPDFVLGHFALGNLQRHLGNINEAERHFRNVSALLEQYPQEQILPESDGITAGRLREIVAAYVSFPAEQHA